MSNLLKSGPRNDEKTDGVVKKLGFSLVAKKKGKRSGLCTSVFEEDDDGHRSDEDELNYNSDIPKEPLVIPLQHDSRKSLQEQARARRQRESGDSKTTATTITTTTTTNNNNNNNNSSVDNKIKVIKHALKDNNNNGATTSPNNAVSSKIFDEDQAVIKILQREADAVTIQGMAEEDNSRGNNKRVIESTDDTFQHIQQQRENSDQQHSHTDFDELPPDISVKSQVYKTVPISEFGAAMLRGMGWSGDHGGKNSRGNAKNDNTKNDLTVMPRPSRLGLGATPKIRAEDDDALDTHSRRHRRPRRQDQMHRDERLKQQQDELERERQKQLAMDKQRNLQIGSIVRVVTVFPDGSNYNRLSQRENRRAIIHKLTGVPGLNMIMIKYEKEATTTKVKKGSIELIRRSNLEKNPFVEGKVDKIDNDKKYKFDTKDSNQVKSVRLNCEGDERRYEKTKDKKSTSCSKSIDPDDSGDSHRQEKKTKKRRDRDDNHRSRGNDHDHRHKRRKDDSGRSLKNMSSSYRRKESDDGPNTWLVSNIRVRIVSSKYGRSVYKEKGVVVDVTRKGVATLKMINEQVINVKERDLETALPKSGGNCIILIGKQRLSKGRLLERNSKKNHGVVQLFEDMSVVTTSLDDIAEWCGPLDDDLEI